MSEDSGQVDVARVPDLENPNFEFNDHSIALFHVRGPFFFFTSSDYSGLQHYSL